MKIKDLGGVIGKSEERDGERQGRLKKDNSKLKETRKTKMSEREEER